jgi:hypothetical protein
MHIASASQDMRPVQASFRFHQFLRIGSVNLSPRLVGWQSPDTFAKPGDRYHKHPVQRSRQQLPKGI